MADNVLRRSPKELAAHVVKLAYQRRVTLATVESCTAGCLRTCLPKRRVPARCCTAGLSSAPKKTAVGVSEKLLSVHTAVSAEVAQAMAEGGLARCPAGLVAAITGVAGPAPDENGNPVGLVYVAAAALDGRRRVVRHDFGQLPQDEICGAAMVAALKLLEELLTAQVP